MHDSRRRKRILHVNMLRKWHTPVTTSFFAAEEARDDEDFPEWKTVGVKQPHMGEQLTGHERADLAELLEGF